MEPWLTRGRRTCSERWLIVRYAADVLEAVSDVVSGLPTEGGTEHDRRVHLSRLSWSSPATGHPAPARPVPGRRFPGPLRRSYASHAPRGVGLLDRRGGRRAPAVDVGGVPRPALRDDHHRHPLRYQAV